MGTKVQKDRLSNRTFVSVNKIVREIPKNDREVIRVEIARIGNYEGVGIRVWYRAVDGEDGLSPSRKGLFVPLHMLADLHEAIEETLEITSGGTQLPEGLEIDE